MNTNNCAVRSGHVVHLHTRFPPGVYLKDKESYSIVKVSQLCYRDKTDKTAFCLAWNHDSLQEAGFVGQEKSVKGSTNAAWSSSGLPFLRVRKSLNSGENEHPVTSAQYRFPIFRIA